MRPEDIHVGSWYWVTHTVDGMKDKIFTGRAKVLAKTPDGNCSVHILYNNGVKDNRMWKAEWFVGPCTDVPLSGYELLEIVVQKIALYSFVAIALYRLFMMEF